MSDHVEAAQQDDGAVPTEFQDVEQPLQDELEVETSQTGEDEVGEEKAERPRFSRPSWQQVRSLLPFLAIILLGAVLRFWGLGDRPLHHDESLHAYFSLQLMRYNMENWLGCLNGTLAPYCYRYDPLTHGPFQFHAIALVYKISQILGAPDHGVNTTTVRIAAATLGTVIVGLPYFLRDRMGKVGAWLASLLLAVSPSMVYFSRFAREDIYMACFTLLMVVAVARYLRTRKSKWLIWAAIAFMLSYATKEATFLTIAIFGSFFGALIAWELGTRWHPKGSFSEHGSWLALLIYCLVMAPVGGVFFALLKFLSIYITQHTSQSDQILLVIKEGTLFIVPWIGVLLGAFVLYILIRETRGMPPLPGRRRLARRIDPQSQPLLDTILTMPWTQWFFALIAAWIVFLVLFTVLFTNIGGGIADGIWQGIYYWLQQQQVARGGQPWYYYLLLIPLYEQIGLVFGFVGVMRCLVRPTRFRLFLVYWFIGSLFIYSWAAEKMPWLMIHITMPMMLLAAIGLEPAVQAMIQWVRGSKKNTAQAVALPPKGMRGRRVGALATVIVAVLLLLPTLENMYQVTYVHAADGPHEMMVYVQTTTDVNTVMDRIAALDQKLYGGKHQVTIGVTDDATWPFIWYLRDYTNTCYHFPSGCPNNGKDVQVILTGGDSLNSIALQYAAAAPGKEPAYLFHQYHMRSWWDEGYKPPPCVVSAKNACAGQPTWGGVGPWLWLSYGDNPPPNAKFNPVLAAQRIWQWWWQRKPFGSTDGSYDMGLLIRSDLGVTP